ncbi:10460_t:CDS:10 [Rhizophagus irregularis]|nr:10460_t:CDS:10 [Rhizophagus irregularis]
MKLDHSHEMVNPEHKKFLHNERIIPQDIKDRIEIYHHASCSVPTIRSILKQEYQGLESWIYNDIYNFLKREIDGFEYETRIDESTNELQVIWMYPEQKQYCRFLDVVFDNTYKVNRFNMPFGIFTGVNNFGQSICFAGTLMCQETIDSFTWTFKLFLKMVNNHPPKVILTDEVKAISQAIQNNFGAHWHDFTKAFYECIKEYKVDNFMIKWQQLKEEKWASRYNRDIFLVDMTTFESALEQRNSDLQLVKYCQNHLNVILKTLSPYKYQVAEVLTNYALKLTQEQLLQSTVYSCVELVELSSGLSIQEKENTTSYQQGNNENTFNAPSPIRRAFQNLPQISLKIQVYLTLFFIQDELPFLFCDQPLPNPLPKKLLEYLKTLRRKKKILETDRGDFCFMHHAELKIVPLGSWFRELALSIYNELGQQPGYYGPKGEIAIADFNGKLSLEEARDIMKNSSDFGAYMYND